MMPTPARRSRSTAPPARARHWRCASTRRGCSAAIPRSCCTAAATPRSRPRWRTWPARRTRCCASRARAGTWRRSSRRACRRCKLEPLRKLRAREALSDEDMVRVQRANLLDPTAPNPSVEMLLHAFLPHEFVDHTHANAVLSLIDQPDGAELAREVYGGRLGLVPYIMPGFGLAKAAADVFDADPRGRGPDPRQARHLHLRRDGARGLRAHDRDGDAGRGRVCSAGASRCSRARRCRKRVARAGRGRADPARRLRAEGRRRRRRVAAADPRVPQQRRHPRVRQRHGGGALRARRRGRRPTTPSAPRAGR